MAKRSNSSLPSKFQLDEPVIVTINSKNIAGIVTAVHFYKLDKVKYDVMPDDKNEEPIKEVDEAKVVKTNKGKKLDPPLKIEGTLDDVLKVSTKE